MAKFRNLTFNDDGTSLSAMWLFAPEPSLMIGIACSWRDSGIATFLSDEDVAQFATHLELCEHTSIARPDKLTLTVTPANRGEPFRTGMDIALRSDDHSDERVFLEDWEVAELAKFVRRKAPDSST